MPFKRNAARRHRIGEMKFKATNWRDYEAGLRRRGSLTLRVTGEASMAFRNRPFPSNLIASSPEPSDQAVLASYGEVAAIPGQIKTNANSGHDEANPPRPQRVADAIAQLVEATERRPLRTVVMPEGMDLGVQRLNEAVSPIQNDMLTSLGMGSML